MNLEFFKEFYPKIPFVVHHEYEQVMINLINDQSLLVELGVGEGDSIRRFKRDGWKGTIVGFDLWKRYSKPTDLDIKLIEGDVRDTLGCIKDFGKINLLAIDLDGDVEATIHSLNESKGLFDYLYIDDLHGFDYWSTGIILDVFKWFQINNISYDILFYTQTGIAFKIDGALDSNYMLATLMQYNAMKECNV